MGNSCTHAADAVLHLVSEDDIRKAVRGIEDWHQAQTTAVRNSSVQNAYGPLLQRVGGIDVVKQVVELFYKKLYGDERLIIFLHDQDVVHLRAKQSMFISWLFGPPNMPYLGRSVRIAHLRIIKQRGFSPDDFDRGMSYFEQAMAELGAPETIIGEVMRRLRPFKDAFFTPSMKDAEEEARWTAEERDKAAAAAEAARQQQQREQEEEEQQQRERRLMEQLTLAQRAAVEREEENPEEEAERAADEAVLAAVSGALSVSRTATATRPLSAPQCPFTGGHIARPASGGGAGAAAVSTSGSGISAAAAGAAPRTPPTPTAEPAGAGSSPRGPGGGGVAASGGRCDAVRRTANQPVGLPDIASESGLGTATGTAGAAAAVQGRSSSAGAPSPPTPPSGTRDRSGTAVREFSSPAGAMTMATATATATLAVPDPLADFEAEIADIEQLYSPDGGGGGQSDPLLPLTLESSPSPSSSRGRGTTAVC